MNELDTLLKEAKEGDYSSQLLLGDYFYHNTLFPDHCSEAYFWTYLATQYCPIVEKAIITGFLEIISSMLSQDEIDKIIVRAEKWKKEHPFQ